MVNHLTSSYIKCSAANYNSSIQYPTIQVNIPLHYRMDPLSLKKKVEQTTPVDLQLIEVKISHPKLQLTNMGMNVRSLIHLHGQKLFKLSVPSACKYSATLNKHIVGTPFVKSALRKPKTYRKKNAQNVIRQMSPRFLMKSCGDCSMICKFNVQARTKKGSVTGQGS